MKQVLFLLLALSKETRFRILWYCDMALSVILVLKAALQCCHQTPLAVIMNWLYPLHRRHIRIADDYLYKML